MYNLVECSGGGETCFAGRLKVVGFMVYYFISWHEEVASAFDIFVLTETKGQSVDTYITKEGSPFAERISAIVLYSAMTAVQDLLAKTVSNERKEQLWTMFGSGYNSSASLRETDFIEMLSTCHRIDLISLDRRLDQLLHDAGNELQMAWRDIFQKIHQSHSFTHCINFIDAVSTHYVVYARHGDLFLSFNLDQRGKFEEASILVRNKETCNSVILSSVAEEFALYLLRWMYFSSSNLPCKYIVL